MMGGIKMDDNKTKNMIKKIAVDFMIGLLILTFFSNTIMNYSLPEVATEQVISGTVSNKVRGQGVVETNSESDIAVSGIRVIKEVKVQVGDEVKKGQVLFTFDEEENSELNEAESSLDSMELNYAKSLLKLAPDYTEDNMNIKDAKQELEAAVDAQEKAEKNDKEIKKLKKSLEKTKKDVEQAEAKTDDLQGKLDAYAEIGDYDTIESQLSEDKKTLARLNEDLQIAQGNGDDTLQIQRDIEDKQAAIDKESKLLDALKNVKALKAEYNAAKKNLESLQDDKDKYETQISELSANLSVSDAKAQVKEKEKSLEALIRALDARRKEDKLSEQADAMDHQAAEKEIEEQKEKIDKLKSSNDLKEVKAEEDGVVYEVNVKEHDTVTPDMPLARLRLSDSGFIVKVIMTKEQGKMIKIGDAANVENIWSDGITANVKNIQVDTENPNRNIIVTFGVKGDDVQIGQTLAFSVGEQSNRYDALIPNSSVFEDSRGKFVLVLKVKGTPLGNRYTVKRVDVEIQASDDTSAGVTGGIYEGDNVITNSSRPLADGMQVRLVQ